jgi:flagellar protein FlaI
VAIQVPSLKALKDRLKPVAGKDEMETARPKLALPALLTKKEHGRSVREYDPKKDGALVQAVVPDGYREVTRYWVEEGRSVVIIGQNQRTNQPEYLLFEPFLSEFEYELLERLFEDMRSSLILTDEEIGMERRLLLLEKMQNLLHEYGVTPGDESVFKLQYFLIRNFIGWGRIEALMKDPYLEDISCDGNNIPIFLYHRKFRNVKTNIMFEAEMLNSLAVTLAQRSGKHISTGTPMLDATLPDGSRLQLTLGTEVTTRGTSFTIRKFREDPFSPIELMTYQTFNADQLVYFWLAIENNKSLIFIGGTASGKTTSLNAVSLFIPPMAKVVSIEDTREITLYHENWIASVTREAVAEGASVISMFDLLRAAMRQRPEYILVGEVRGVEAQTLFQAMNTGHTTFSTMHAGSVDAAIHRLENEPLNVPRNMITALNIVSIQALVYRGTERVRRSLEIVEIAGVDPSTGNLRVNTVFVYDPVKDLYLYKGRSQVYADITERRGWSRERFEQEIATRKRILEAMQQQGIIDYIRVSRIFQAYSIDPAQVIRHLDNLAQVLE